MANLRLLSSGKAAMTSVAKVAPTASRNYWPSVRDVVELVPGTIWNGNKMLVRSDGATTYYTIDDRLYEITTSDFVRDEWMGALQKAASGAKIWIVIAKAEMTLLSGLFVPLYMLVGASCAKVGLFYVANKVAVNEAMRLAWPVIRGVRNLRSANPVLFGLIQSQIIKEVWMELRQGHGITADDVAFFVGRVFMNLAAAPELTLSILLKVLLKIGTIVAITHFPSAVVHAAEAAAKRGEEDLKVFLASAGYTVTIGEAKEILREAASAATQKDMAALSRDLSALLPHLEKLADAEGL